MNDFKAQTANRGKMNEKLICLQTLLWRIFSIFVRHDRFFEDKALLERFLFSLRTNNRVHTFGNHYMKYLMYLQVFP